MDAAPLDEKPATRRVSRAVASPWLSLLGTLALIAALGVAKRLLVPIALAALITFLMSPIVGWLERRVGRVPAVLGAVAVVFVVLAGSSWVLLRQLDGVSSDLPRFRVTLVGKLSHLRSLSQNRTVDELRKTIDSVQNDLSTPADTGRPARVIVAESAAAHGPFAMLGPVLGLGASAGLVTTLVIFMLLERRDLVDRLIELAGRRQVVMTMSALDEASARVARQLLMQLLVNAIYGVVAGLGLWALDVPYPFVWAVLGAMLRFVPYVGPLIGFTTPVVIAVAALDGWGGPLKVAALMLSLELFTNLVLETVLYAGAAGVSQVGLLVAVTFWTWLWGAPGLVMAIPLTVCLVVVGRHVRGLEYLATLMSDAPPLSPSHTFYQRLLTFDTTESTAIIDKYVAEEAPRSVFDALIVPALTHAETDRLHGRLDASRQQRFVTATRAMLAEAATRIRAVEQQDEAAPTPVATAPVRVLGYGMNDQLDELALDAFVHMTDDLPIDVDRLSNLLVSEVLQRVHAGGYPVVCLADLPPSSPLRTRHLVKRLRDADASVAILVGRWGAMAKDDPATLRAAGADHVAATLDETRRYLRDFVVRHSAMAPSRRNPEPQAAPPAAVDAVSP